MTSADQFVQKAPQMHPLGSMSMAPLLGGLSPEEGWKSLHLLGNVMPRIKQLGLTT